MVGYAGSPTYTAYADMTLTRSKVKVKVTRLLNFRQLAKPCMLAAMTAAPLRGFLVLRKLAPQFPSSIAFNKIQIFNEHFIFATESYFGSYCNIYLHKTVLFAKNI